MKIIEISFGGIWSTVKFEQNEQLVSVPVMGNQTEISVEILFERIRSKKEK